MSIPISPDPQYDVFWNAAIAQHTYDQLDRDKRAEAFMRANVMLSENNLTTDETVTGEYDELISTVNEDFGLSMPTIRRVGPIAFWYFLGSALRVMRIAPNLGRIPCPSWKPPVLLASIIRTSSQPEEATCQRVLDDLDELFGIKMTPKQ